MNRVNEASRKYTLSINISKTKIMTVSKKKTENVQLEIAGEQAERVLHFKYLGVYINEDMNLGEEMKI